MRAAAALALAALALVHAPVDSASAPKINGWYPCTDSIARKTTTTAAPTMFECAEVEVPLCHTGVCTSTKTINVFVKRILATKPTKPRKAMWLLEGGPGYASVGMEMAMKNFHAATASAVDLYTLDHRGVGRSNYLECKAAQAFSAGSPGGVELDFGEVPNCIKDIMFQIENKTEAFSVTSAAKDVAFLIDALNGKDTEVFVYGGSYGTYWGTRVMHLAPPQVRGYVLDGVVDEKTATFTTWNKNRRYAEARYLKLCEKDKFCSSKLAKEIKNHGNLSDAMRALYKRLDAAAPGKDACADLVRKLDPIAKPSITLKGYLGTHIQSDPARVAIPALIHRFYTCSAKDAAFLKQLLTADNKSGSTLAFASSTPPAAKDHVMGGSDFLGSLIKASEMWTTPSPSWDDEVQNMDNGLFSTSIALDFAMICFLRGNFKDPMCKVLIANAPKIDFSKLSVTPYVYKPDAYWHKYASIPSHASAMVINGGLDFQTPSEWGTAEYEGLQGKGSKMLVEFETGVHCAGISDQTASDATKCGYRIIASYVLGGGAVSKVDTSCIDSLPAFDFADLKAIQHAVKGVKTVDELYG